MTSVIKIGILFLRVIYFFLKLLPQKNKITCISRQTDTPTQEFLMLKSRIAKENPKVQVVILCKTLKGGAKATLVSKCLYGFHVFVQMYHTATSKVVVLDTYCIPVSLLKHKENLKVIQMWHSMGTMKLFGYTALDTLEGSGSRLARLMRMHRNYDYVFASSDAYKQHLANGFDCDINKIMTMPLPRLDLLKSREYEQDVRERIFSKYPSLKAKPVVLYCPTFRLEEKDFEKALKKLISAFDFEKYNLVVKLHPLSKVVLPENVADAKGFSSMDLLFVADHVISDYSCIVYEAAVRGIPLYFYDFDIDMYLQNRGLAIDYFGELPGTISKEPKGIMKAIESDYDRERLIAFANKYVTPIEDVTGKIVDFIFKIGNIK